MLEMPCVSEAGFCMRCCNARRDAGSIPPQCYRPSCQGIADAARRIPFAKHHSRMKPVGTQSGSREAPMQVQRCAVQYWCPHGVAWDSMSSTLHRSLLALTSDSLAALLEWEALRDALYHTEQSIVAMDAAGERFVASLPGTRAWQFPKMAAIMAYVHTIRELGSAAVASTAYGEAAHKSIKPWINRTNRHHGTFLRQMVREHARNMTAHDVAAAFWETHTAEDETVLRGLAQKASSQGRVVPARATLRPWYLGELCPPHAQELLSLTAAFPGQAELAHFAASFHCFLKEHEGDIPASTFSADYPTDDGQVQVFPAIGLPHALHREDELGACVLHVSPAFGSSQKAMYPDVAIKASGQQDMWYGQPRLLFTFRRGGQEFHAALVRWYEELSEGVHQRAGLTGPVAARSATGMKHLKWAKVRMGGQTQDWYGCVLIASILRPAFIQPDPLSADHSYYNPFMR